MAPPDVARAIDAARSIASSLGLRAHDAIVLQRSNKVSLRLRPCDVFARVAPVAHQHARFEVELAQRLAATDSPVAALDPRVAPRGYERDGFEVTFWTYYDTTAVALAPTVYADALARLHAGLRLLDLPTPHMTDRVASAEQIVASPDPAAQVADADRELVEGTLRRLRRAIRDHGAAEQVLHGEPHPGNVLDTASGPRFIDLETCCRGPVEFDLAHVPDPVTERYPGVDRALLTGCRELVLAMVVAWRWEPGDRLPDGERFGRALVTALRAGPPWPTIGEVHRGLDAP